MIIYHGSEFIIDQPQYSKGRRNNDYGRGFYCTEHPDVAREWSVTSEHDGYLNIYDFKDDGLNFLNLNDHSTMTWLAVLLENRVFDVSSPLAREAKEYISREFRIDYEKYDVIVGYRADDSYFSFASDFINGIISYEQLCEAMRLGELGDQIVLKSRKAFKRISYQGCEKVSRQLWHPKRESRDKRAREKYFSLDKRYVKGAIYVTKILDEEMKQNDYRLR